MRGSAFLRCALSSSSLVRRALPQTLAMMMVVMRRRRLHRPGAVSQRLFPLGTSSYRWPNSSSSNSQATFGPKSGSGLSPTLSKRVQKVAIQIQASSSFQLRASSPAMSDHLTKPNIPTLLFLVIYHARKTTLVDSDFR